MPKKDHRPVRRQIENQLVPLSSDWLNCMALKENKADLALLVSNYMYLIEHSPRQNGGCFWRIHWSYIRKVFRPNTRFDYTRSWPWWSGHASNSSLHPCSYRVNGRVCDTDVLVLLLAHYDQMQCQSFYGSRYVETSEIYPGTWNSEENTSRARVSYAMDVTVCHNSVVTARKQHVACSNNTTTTWAIWKRYSHRNHSQLSREVHLYVVWSARRRYMWWSMSQSERMASWYRTYHLSQKHFPKSCRVDVPRDARVSSAGKCA